MKVYNILSIVCALGMASSACAMRNLPPEIQRHVMRHQLHQRDFRHAPQDQNREMRKNGLSKRVHNSKKESYINKQMKNRNYNMHGRGHNKFGSSHYGKMTYR